MACNITHGLVLIVLCMIISTGCVSAPDSSNSTSGVPPRSGHSSVAMPDGSILLMGGELLVSQSRSGDTVTFRSRVFSDIWRSTDNGATWSRVTAKAGWSPRVGHSSVVMPDGSIVLMGGYDYSNEYENDVWRSTDKGATWTFMTKNAGWTPRSGHSSVVMPDGSIVVMGGIDSSKEYRNDVWRSTDNGATWTCMTKKAGWTPRSGHSSVVMPDGSIVLMLGGAGMYDVWRSTDNGATWTYMTRNLDWTSSGDHSSVALPDGSIVLMRGGTSRFENDVWRSIDKGATWTCVTENPGWMGISSFSSVAMPDGSIVLISGEDSVTNDVWRSTDKGATWTRITTGTDK
jgi:photosystem II stability/assembly factor-like uncharacterized protein